MGFHEYLHVRTEPTNKKSRFAVGVISHENSVVGHLMKGKSGRFAKTIFYFLRASIMGAGFVILTKMSIKEMIKALRYQLS